MTKEQVICNYIIFLFRDSRKVPRISNSIAFFRPDMFSRLNSMFNINDKESSSHLLRATNICFDSSVIEIMYTPGYGPSGVSGISGSGGVSSNFLRPQRNGPVRVGARRKLYVH